MQSPPGAWYVEGRGLNRRLALFLVLRFFVLFVGIIFDRRIARPLTNVRACHGRRWVPQTSSVKSRRCMRRSRSILTPPPPPRSRRNNNHTQGTPCQQGKVLWTLRGDCEMWGIPKQHRRAGASVRTTGTPSWHHTVRVTAKRMSIRRDAKQIQVVLVSRFILDGFRYRTYPMHGGPVDFILSTLVNPPPPKPFSPH